MINSAKCKFVTADGHWSFRNLPYPLNERYSLPLKFGQKINTAFAWPDIREREAKREYALYDRDGDGAWVYMEIS